MLGRMAGRVHHIDNDITKRQTVAVLDCTCRERHLGPGMQNIFSPGLAGERAPRGTMIGMDMGVDDEANAHPGVVGHPQIWCDVAHRIDHGAGGAPAAAEQIGNRNGVGMEELTQDHASSHSATAALLGRRHTFNYSDD